eukprot:gene9003-9965_t
MTFVTRNLFLWCLAAIYLFAFVSLYFQIPGLYGKNGLLPARIHLREECSDKNRKCSEWATAGECDNNPVWMSKNCEVSCNVCKGERSLKDSFWRKPTLLWFAPLINLSVDSMMDLLCILGAAISFGILVSTRARNSFSFALLWFLYFSLYQVGQTFLWFQWDILLLETGFLAIILAPVCCSQKRTDRPRFGICFWLVKWLIFRLMFQSGVVKLTSQCPTWWGLTALNYHYESQCIPTSLAWYAHQLPDWFQRLSVALMFVIEIPIPFLFFFPLRSVRIFAFFAQVLFQVLIILTGNYNFFNILTIVLCLPLVDDEFILQFLPRFITLSLFSEEQQQAILRRRKDHVVIRVIKRLIEISVAISMFYWTAKIFDLRMDEDKTLHSQITFSKDEFNRFLEVSVPLSIGIGLFYFILEAAKAFYKCIQLKSAKEKFFSVAQTTFYVLLAMFMFSVSLVPYTDIERGTQSRIWPVIHKWHKNVDRYQVTNAYGLFRSMTGVGGRPEIIIEGSNNINGPWKEYDFRYKPGKLAALPSFLIPHQPRLDWQMWFAALSNYQYNPWFISLIDKLLRGNEDVLALLGANPFPDRPPMFIKSTLYSYHYTKLPRNTTSISDGIAKSRKIKRWWKRNKPAEYTPPLSIDNADVKAFLRHHDLTLEGPWPEKPDGVMHSVLLRLRMLIHQLDPTWTMLRLALIAALLCKWKSRIKSYASYVYSLFVSQLLSDGYRLTRPFCENILRLVHKWIAIPEYDPKRLQRTLLRSPNPRWPFLLWSGSFFSSLRCSMASPVFTAFDINKNVTKLKKTERRSKSFH